MPRPIDAHPALRQFLGAYLHQDFLLEHPSAEDAIGQAVRDHEADLGQISVELADARQHIQTEDEARRFLEGLCGYHPPDDGRTYLAWLDHLAEVVATGRA